MIGDRIDTFRIFTPAVNRKFLREKVELRQVPVTVPHTQKFNLSNMSLWVLPFCSQYLRFEQPSVWRLGFLAKKFLGFLSFLSWQDFSRNLRNPRSWQQMKKIQDLGKKTKTPSTGSKKCGNEQYSTNSVSY